MKTIDFIPLFPWESLQSKNTEKNFNLLQYLDTFFLRNLELDFLTNVSIVTFFVVMDFWKWNIIDSYPCLRVLVVRKCRRTANSFDIFFPFSLS